MPARKQWTSFALSMIGHIGAVAFLTWFDTVANTANQNHPAYQVVMLPPESRPKDHIVWYNSPKTLPDIAPTERFGPMKTPAGEEDPRVLVTNAPKAPATKQIIRQPDQPKLIPEDVPAPNLVKLPPKTFVPPAPVKASPKREIAPLPVTEPAALTPPQPIRNDLGALTSIPRLPPKVFVPPVGRPSTAGAQAPAVPDATPLPDIGSQLNPSPGAQALMVGLLPSAVTPPEGSRPGQIAKAPTAGPPSSGAVQPGAVQVPGIVAHGMPPNPAPPATATPGRVVKEIVLPGVNRTMSAPLRPSSRILPANIEVQFASRNVYTLVIPGPGLPEYAGDWVMWFAERQPGGDTSARILAPIPARKSSKIDQNTASQSAPVAATLQLAATIDRDGRLNAAKIIRTARVDLDKRKAVEDRALEELASWEFKPAMRNGEPMETDIVVEIPFLLHLAAQ